MNIVLQILLNTLENNPTLLFSILQALLDMAKSDPELSKQLVEFVRGLIKK